MNKELSHAQLQELHQLIEGATVSVDVSTGDTDNGSRLFARIDTVFQDNGELVIVAVEPEYNQQPSVDQATDLLLRFLGLSVTDYEELADLRRDVRDLLSKRQIQAALLANTKFKLPIAGATQG